MAKAYMRSRSEEADDGLTADSAITKLAVQKWEALKALSNKCVEAGDKIPAWQQTSQGSGSSMHFGGGQTSSSASQRQGENQAQTVKKMHGDKKSGLFCDKTG